MKYISIDTGTEALLIPVLLSVVDADTGIQLSNMDIQVLVNHHYTEDYSIAGKNNLIENLACQRITSYICQACGNGASKIFNSNLSFEEPYPAYIILNIELTVNYTKVLSISLSGYTHFNSLMRGIRDLEIGLLEVLKEAI